MAESSNYIGTEQHGNRAEQCGVCLAIATLLLVYCGATVRVALPLAVGMWVVFRHRSVFRLERVLRLLLMLYPLYVGTVEVAYWRLGLQGVDFGMFSQLIFQVAEFNSFKSSLIANQWTTFFAVHFSPYLIVLGIIAKLGLPAHAVLIGAHCISVVALIAGTQTLIRAVGGSQLVSYLVATLVLVAPGVRQGIVWETHDEVIALSLVVWSLVMHKRGRHIYSLVLLGCTFLFKETFGLVGFMTCCYYALDDRSHTKSSLLFGCFGLLFFVLVTQIFPGTLYPQIFDPMIRLSTWSELFDPATLRAKALWLCKITLPAIPLVIALAPRGYRLTLLLLFPCLYNIATVLLSNHPPMYEPSTYYAVTPAILMIIAAVVPALKSRRIVTSLSLSIACASLVGPSVPSFELAREAFTRPSARAELRSKIAKDVATAADDYSASLLFDNRTVWRLHNAPHPDSYDVAVVTKSKAGVISGEPCAETARHIALCARRGGVGVSP